MLFRPVASPPIAQSRRSEPPLPRERPITVTDLEQAVGPIRDDLDQIARDIGEIRRGVNRLLAQASQEPKALETRGLSQAATRSISAAVSTASTAPHVPAVAPVVTEETSAASRSSASEPQQSLQDLIIANFDSVDRESGRNHAAARAGFLTRLGDRVKRVEFVDNAVLFYPNGDTAYVHPWPNQRLGHTWLSHFRLSRGSNYPILRLEALAFSRQRDDGGWDCLQKGYAKNGD